MTELIRFLIFVIISNCLVSCTFFQSAKSKNKAKKHDALRNESRFKSKSIIGQKKGFQTRSYSDSNRSKIKVKKLKSQNDKVQVLETSYCSYQANHWSTQVQEISEEDLHVYIIKGYIREGYATLDELLINRKYLDRIMLTYGELERISDKPKMAYDAPATLFPEFVQLRNLFTQLDRRGVQSGEDVRDRGIGKYHVHSEAMTKIIDGEMRRVVVSEAYFLVNQWYCTKVDRVYIEQDNYVSPAERVKQAQRSISRKPRSLATMKGEYSLVQKYSPRTNKYHLKLSYVQTSAEGLGGALLDKKIKCMSDHPIFILSGVVKPKTQPLCHESSVYFIDD